MQGLPLSFHFDYEKNNMNQRVGSCSSLFFFLLLMASNKIYNLLSVSWNWLQQCQPLRHNTVACSNWSNQSSPSAPIQSRLNQFDDIQVQVHIDFYEIKETVNCIFSIRIWFWCVAVLKGKSLNAFIWPYGETCSYYHGTSSTRFNASMFHQRRKESDLRGFPVISHIKYN